MVHHQLNRIRICCSYLPIFYISSIEKLIFNGFKERKNKKNRIKNLKKIIEKKLTHFNFLMKNIKDKRKTGQYIFFHLNRQLI